MTVGVAQARINEMNKLVDALKECAMKLRDGESEEVDKLRDHYGLTKDLLFEVAQTIYVTANDFQKDLNDCEVNCKCW